MWSFVIGSYFLVGVIVVFIQYKYITTVAIEVLNDYSHLTSHWSNDSRKNYVNYVMPGMFIPVWPSLFLP